MTRLSTILARNSSTALALAIPLALHTAPALAQRTAENVTTQSTDAFGRGVGTERSGLYSQEDTRGFSPTEAGNVRLQGLSIDLIDRFSNRLIEGSTIRVGYAAQRYPFPAPTGLVDYRLTLPTSDLGAALDLDHGNAIARGLGGNVMLDLPLDGERLGIAGGLGFRDSRRFEGGTSLFINYSALLAFRPAKDTEFFAFSSGILQRHDVARATYFAAGTVLPPQIERGKFLGLDWAEGRRDSLTHGLLARFPLAPGWHVESGLFHSSRTAPVSFSDLLTGVTPDGRASNRVVTADQDSFDRSLSGEARVVHDWKSGAFAHTLTASLRGRSRDRAFGGASRRSLGAGSIYDASASWVRPTFAFTPKNREAVRQLTPGLAYSLVWNGRVSLDLGLARSSYNKTVDFGDPLLATLITRDRPLLWNIGGSLAITRDLAVYAGHTRGQEEAQVAPEIASNRSEAPPALRTRQTEAGLRYALNSHISVIVGAFSITKPYYNLDPAARYRQLGTLSNRGIELSLTGRLAPGLTIVGGTLLLDPKISGEAVDTKLIGPRPVGQLRRRTTVNLDWRLAGGKSPLSFDMAVDSQSARIANAANTLVVPARVNINLGARYRFDLGKVKLVFRPQVINLFNTYSWQVSSSGGLTYTTPRTLALNVAADF